LRKDFVAIINAILKEKEDNPKIIIQACILFWRLVDIDALQDYETRIEETLVHLLNKYVDEEEEVLPQILSTSWQFVCKVPNRGKSERPFIENFELLLEVFKNYSYSPLLIKKVCGLILGFRDITELPWEQQKQLIAYILTAMRTHKRAKEMYGTCCGIIKHLLERGIQFF